MRPVAGVGVAMSRPLPGWMAPAPDSAIADAVRRGKSPWSEFIHLLWSMWILVTPAFGDGFDGRWLLLTALSYPVFLWLYAQALLVSRRATWRYALGMVGLCLVLLPQYPSALSYFVFGCVMLRGERVRGIARHVGAILALNAVVIGAAWWIGYPWQMLVWLPMVTLVISLIVRVEHAGDAHDAALRLSHDEVRRLAALAERERIGRDLHDLLGHTLSLVALKSELAGRLVQRDPAAAQREIADVSRVAREALSQVRSAVTGIRAAGIAAELASAKLLLECDGIVFRYAVDDRSLDGRMLPPRVETALALTVREAVTNIQRHARASQADIAFQMDRGEAVLRIVDDGRGGAIVPGNGLGGMRERIEALGGRLRIDSGAGQGTHIEARLPLAANDDGGGEEGARLHEREE